MTVRYTLRSRSEIRLLGVKLLLVFVSFIYFSHLSATNHTAIDRTSRLINQSERSPALVDALLELASDYGRSKLDSSVVSLEEALALSVTLGYIEGELLALKALTIANKNMREHEKAVLFGNRGLNLCLKYPHPQIEAALLNTLGTVFSRTTLPDSASEYYYKSLNVSLQHGDMLMASKVYNNLGIFYTSLGANEEAKQSFLNCHKISESLGNESALYRSQLNLGGIYFELEVLDSADFYYKQALDGYQKQNNSRLVAMVTQNLASVKMEQGLYEEAFQLYSELLTSDQLLGNPDMHIGVYHNLGSMFREQDKHKEALGYYKKAISLAREHEQEGLLLGLHKHIAISYEAVGNFAVANGHLREFNALNEKFYDENKTRALEDMRVKYETAQQEKRLILAREEQKARKNERNTFISVSVLLALLLGLGYIAYRTKQRANHRLSTQKEIIQRKEKEKTLLLRELHHRVKNNLQLISSLLNLQAYQLKDEAAASAVKEGQARVEAMAMIHRQLYLKEEETKISLPDYLDNMMQNLLYAFGKEAGAVEVDQRIADLEIDADLAIPLGLVINELLTNSLKYAFHTVESPRLTIKAEQLPQHQLYIQVADNGPGITSETNRQTSFGMEMVKSLAKQMKAELEINQEGGHSVSLTIPFRKPPSDQLMTSYA